ncbi:MAG: ring-opening amidohydrolase [Lautropia sp.]
MSVQNAAIAGNPNSVQVRTLPMQGPEDVTGLAAAFAGGLDAAALLALFVKTEGNGLDNDWSRPLAVRAVLDLLAAQPARGASSAATPMIVVSGGCEGFLTPHMIVVSRGHGGLRCATAESRPLGAHEIGTASQIEATAAAFRSACRALEAGDIGYAHAVAPWIDDSLPAAGPRVAEDAHASKPFTRAATALGAAVALDGLPMAAAIEALGARDAAVHGLRCGVTAGATGGRVRVLVLANGDAADARARDTPFGAQRVACVALRDPLDLASVQASVPAGRRALGVFFKGDPPPTDRVRGERVVLGRDSDLHAFRHYRAAMSGVLGAGLGTTRLFVGGGAEHQCPAGGALLSVVTEPLPDAEPGEAERSR